MADLLDIETALANLCGAALYPNGTGQPCAANVPCSIYPGWPNQETLAQSLAAGKVDVSIFTPQNMERDTTRYAREWYDLIVVASTLTISVSGTVITIGGSVTIGHYVTAVVANQAFSYAAVNGDTLATVAAALAALMPTGMVTAQSGATITLKAAETGRIVCRTAAPGTIAREVGRQQRGFMISIWAPSPKTRSDVAKVLMAAIQGTDYLSYVDGTNGRLTWRQSNESDGKENAGAYRRDIHVWAEFATIQTAPGYPITTTQITEQPANGAGELAPSTILVQ